MKLERLQMRIERDLKVWFEKYSKPKGGMSVLVRDFIKDLKEKNEDGRDDEERAGD